MVTFVQSYSYNRPFDGSHNVEVALGENEFDTPAIAYTFAFSFSTVHIYLRKKLDTRQDGHFCVILWKNYKKITQYDTRYRRLWMWLWALSLETSSGAHEYVLA